MSRKPGVLFVINDFNVGGAELLVMRLGKALSEDYRVFILDIYPGQSNVDFKKNFDESGFTYIQRFTPLSKLRESVYWKINAVYQLLGIKGKFNILKKKYQENKLIEKLKKEEIRLLHSHYFSSDCYTRTFLKDNDMKWVITMHGDYNKKVYENLTEKDRLAYIEAATKNISECDVLTHVADINLEILSEYGIKASKVKKIRLGLESDNSSGVQITQSNKDFTFCMVARANPDKGWQKMVDAFVSLHKKYPETKLICVGPKEGILKELSDKLNGNDSIQFTGYTNDPVSFIQQSDVCLLPTTFEGESSPYSIIEYLSCGKPVISTDKGEIPDMISYNGKLAGILLPIDSEGNLNVEQLEASMESLLLNQTLYKQYEELAKFAFEKFTMNKCKNEYTELYDLLLNQ